MKDLVWDATLSVQVPELDEEHRMLVDLFNLLKHSVEEESSADYIEAVFEELVRCTAWHFSHEERLMLEHGYAELARHKSEHQDLIESARALQQRFEQEAHSFSSGDIAFLEHWVTGHILGSDMDMGAYLCGVM